MVLQLNDCATGSAIQKGLELILERRKATFVQSLPGPRFMKGVLYTSEWTLERRYSRYSPVQPIGPSTSFQALA